MDPGKGGQEIERTSVEDGGDRCLLGLELPGEAWADPASPGRQEESVRRLRQAL